MGLPTEAEVLLELYKTGFAIIPIAAGWLVGQRIISSWDLRKKRQEIDVVTAVQFQQLYGEFKEVGRLWRVVKRPRESQLEPPATIRWSLLERATAAESKFEAIVIKLATERALNQEQVETLGLFRQACQQLRESIRDDIELPSSGFGPEYLLFNSLAARVTSMIGTARGARLPKSEVAQRNLNSIAAIRSSQWQAAVASAPKL